MIFYDPSDPRILGGMGSVDAMGWDPWGGIHGKAPGAQWNGEAPQLQDPSPPSPKSQPKDSKPKIQSKIFRIYKLKSLN